MHAAANAFRYPLVNVAVRVLGWSVDGDASGADWVAVLKACTERGIRSVWQGDDDVEVLEPAMRVEIRAESDCFGAVSADLVSGRRAVISDVRIEDRDRVVTALVPLQEMIGYSAVLRKTTGGRGQFSMEFDKYVVKQ